VLARRLGVLGLLDVVGEDHTRHRAARARHAHRAVDQMPGLGGLHADLDELAGDVLEQRRQVDLLLVVGAERRALLLADDRHDRLVVELGVIEPVEQMDGAGAGGRQADADLAGELRVRGRGQRGDLLVARLEKLDALSELVKGAKDPVDAVARIPVDAAHPPVGKPPQHVLPDSLSHGRCLPNSRTHTPEVVP
jgi:hypothetical protein